jgi:predicted nucleic acid-binding protein
LIILIDTNIFLNVIREEKGFLESSEELLRKVQSREITGLASCVVLMEVKWALFERKEYAKADKAVALIEEIVEIVPVDREMAKEAIDLKISKKTELLDSIHVVTAAIQNAVLVTRDDDLRKKAEGIISVKKPEEILREIGSG